MISTDENYLPISLVAQTVFCPRRAWLEANGETTDTSQMQHGYSAHKNVDDPKTSRSRQRRSVLIRSDSLGLSGKCDAIESEEDGTLRVVEYKSTPVRKNPQITEANRVQLALQGICLEESGESVSEFSVHFTDHNKTIAVELSEDDFALARDYVEQTHKIVESEHAPKPLEDSPKCSWCSHVSVCLPDEHFGRVTTQKIVPSKPDSQVAHLTVQGSRATIKQGRLIVQLKGEQLGDIPLERIHSVVVHGNIDISSALLRELMWRNHTVIWCSSTGRVYGWSQAGSGPNGLARVQQHVLAERGSLPISCEMISSKIANQATLLRCNGEATETVKNLRKLQQEALKPSSLPELFGIEGEAASLYFANFNTMLNGGVLETLGWEWQGRVGRGANDPINILLNYAYGLLTSECIRAILTCGLDPHAGFLHSSNRNKPALALDLMEEFRAIIADSVVVSLINRKQVDSASFSTVGGSLRLSPVGRKTIIKAFEHRINTEFRHPIFGYSVSWRRTIEIQARMILGVLNGSHSAYTGVKVR